jgi:acyl-CoA thioesterase YciA
LPLRFCRVIMKTINTSIQGWIVAKKLNNTNKVVKPKGECLIQTLAMPADTNPHGDIFGGWVLSQMDIAGSILARKIAVRKVVTVAVEAMEFLRPVLVGDILCCYVEKVRVGNTSVTVKIEAWALRQLAMDLIKVTEGSFTYVAVDDTRRPIPIKKKN